MSELNGKRVGILLADDYNEAEFWYPRTRLQEAGAEVVVAGSHADKPYCGEEGIKAFSNAEFSAIKSAEYDGVVIPGGYAPDHIRVNPDALESVRSLFEAGKMVAFICHAGWVPASAGILKGKRATSVRSIKDDMVNAGCQWEDSEVVVDGNLISSRQPQDLPAFMKAILSFLKGGR